MLHYAVVFFVVALIAAVLGFRGIAGLSAEIGWVFAVLAVIFLVVALLAGPSPGPVVGSANAQTKVASVSCDSPSTPMSLAASA